MRGQYTRRVLLRLAAMAGITMAASGGGAGRGRRCAATTGGRRDTCRRGEPEKHPPGVLTPHPSVETNRNYSQRVVGVCIRVFISGAGAIPRTSGRGYAPSLRDTDYVQKLSLSFQQQNSSHRLRYIGAGIGRNGADSEPSSGGGLSAPSNETISERPVTERWRRELSSPVVTVESTTLPPTLLTP